MAGNKMCAAKECNFIIFYGQFLFCSVSVLRYNALKIPRASQYHHRLIISVTVYQKR